MLGLQLLGHCDCNAQRLGLVVAGPVEFVVPVNLAFLYQLGCIDEVKALGLCRFFVFKGEQLNVPFVVVVEVKHDGRASVVAIAAVYPFNVWVRCVVVCFISKLGDEMCHVYASAWLASTKAAPKIVSPVVGCSPAHFTRQRMPSCSIIRRHAWVSPHALRDLSSTANTAASWLSSMFLA